VVPFGEWLDEVHDIDFNFATGDFVDALHHKASGKPVETSRIWPLLKAFFETEMHRQQPISGAIAAITQLADHADVVVLTNLTDDVGHLRSAQLTAVGLDFPVHTNQGGKGELMARLIADYQPSVAVFVDDLVHQHASVADHAPEVFRLHMVGEPLLAPNVPKAPAAHARIDDWHQATQWIMNRFNGVPLDGQ
jgi:hypothetical protein